MANTMDSHTPTHKDLKLQAALAFWLTLISFVMLAGQASMGNPSPPFVALFTACIGWYIISKIRIWWHHH